MASRIDRVGTSSNLEEGGKYELLILKFPDSYPEGVLEFKIGDDPKKITGVQKVAQVFMYVLFTTKGSDVFKPNFGTDYNLVTRFSNIDNRTGVFAAQIISSVKDAEGQVKSILGGGSDLASQLDKVEVLEVDSLQDSTTVSIYLLTRAGEQAAVAIPFPRLDMEVLGG